MKPEYLRRLIGRTVNGFYLLKDGQESCIFETDLGNVRFDCLADCCSETWFSDVVNLDALIGSPITSIQDNPMDGYNVADGRGRQEEDQVYGYTITTCKGQCTLAFRNSSNGYYGGDISEGSACGGINPEIWEKIEKDYPV